MARGLTIKATIAWWLPLYLWAIKWFYVVTGKEPDWDKVEIAVKRAIRVIVK